MKTLSQKQILAQHSALIKEFGGSDGVRDEGLLESRRLRNLRRRTSLSILQRKGAAAGLVCNHPFVDGIKRIGAHAMLVFLAVNGIELCYEQQELIDVILAVASGETDRQGLLQWILDHE